MRIFNEQKISGKYAKVIVRPKVIWTGIWTGSGRERLQLVEVG